MRARLQVESRKVRSETAIGNARGTWSEREHVLVTIEDETGGRGIGEAAPMAGHSRESCERPLFELSNFGKLELPATAPKAILRWLETTSSRLRSPSARFALESALLDWAGRREGVSAATLLGASPDSVLENTAAILGPPGAWRDEIARLHALGYRTFKLKVSPSTFESALDLVPVLHRNMSDLRVRLDGNRSLPSALVEAARDRLSGIEFVEEPCDGGAPAGVPLALDESMSDPGWPERAGREGARVVVLKPAAIGGMAATFAAAEIARAQGLGVVVSYLWEGPVGWAASIAAALALGGRALVPGLGPHPQLAAWPAHTVASVDGSRLRNARTPGLGVSWSAP